MNVIERNRTASQHGSEGEEAAVAWLEKQNPAMRIKIINRLLDLFAGETFVEVKTCAESVRTTFGKMRRSGRFTMSRAQHSALLRADGYYLFVVLFEDGTKLLWLVSAKDLHFTKQIAWTVAYDQRQAFGQSTLREE